MIKLFNDEKLPVLLCTSTLIEGINTAAKTVMIYDKKINRSNYDFFTFSNIKGRAGRLGEHHVGQVMLFNEVPDKTELEISPTFFGEEKDYPDEYIVHIDEREKTQHTDERMIYLRNILGLDKEGLHIASSIRLENAIILRTKVQSRLASRNELVWGGIPSYSEIQEVVELICEVRNAINFGTWTAKQLTYYINQLRRTNSYRDFLIDQDTGYKGKPEEYDNIFKFLRACEYGLAQYFSCVELFVHQFDQQVDYSLFIGELSSWFQPELLKELDEEGIPIQISERFFSQNDTKETLLLQLQHAIERSDDTLTDFERDWLSDII